MKTTSEGFETFSCVGIQQSEFRASTIGEFVTTWEYAIESIRDVYPMMVLPKPYAKQMASVRRQWSGCEKRVIQGIGLVTCVYVNPKTHEYWIIDYRIYDPDRDMKTKLQHLQEMLHNGLLREKSPVSGGVRRFLVCFNGRAKKD